MKLTIAEMQTRVASNPSLVLVSCTKVEDGTELDGITPSYKIVFTDSPANFKIDCEPVEETPGGIWAILENLDYVAP